MGQITDKKKYSDGHLPQLDGIKGLICFFIIFVHYYNRTPSGAFPIFWIPSVFVEKGWMFVEFFFIISGFLFAYSQKERIKTAKFGGYVLARLKRVYPPVLFITVLDVVLRLVQMVINQTGDRLSVSGVLQSLTFATTWIYNGEPFPTVVWYIHVLFLCYLVYYLIGKGKDQSAYLTGVIALAFFGWALYTAKLDLPFLYKNIGRGYLAFSVGLLIHEFQVSVPEHTRKILSYTAAILAGATVALGMSFTFDAVFGDLLLAYTLFLFPTAMLCLLNIPLVAKIFSMRPLVWLGKLSMSTFLVHVPVMNLIQALCYRSGSMPFNRASSFYIVLLLIFAASAAWYYLVERKLIPKFVCLFRK